MSDIYRSAKYDQEMNRFRVRIAELESENGSMADDICSLTTAHERAEQAEAENKRLLGHIKDIAAHATPLGDIPDDPGWIGTYLLTAGALHRALGTLGHTMPSCQAEAELAEFMAATDDLRAFLKPDDVVTVSAPGKRGSVAFAMGRFIELNTRLAERSTP